MNITILVMAIFLGILVGGFCGLCLMGMIFCDTYGKHTFGKIVTILISIGIFTLLCYGGLSSEHRDFNNGNCPRCGTHYQAIEHQHGSTYYECPNCFFGTWH